MLKERIYKRVHKAKMSNTTYSTMKSSKVCTQAYKQKAKILNMRNTLKIYRKFRQKQILILIWHLHSNTKRNSQRRIYDRLHEKEMSIATL